ncbi:MAG: putative Histone deacetylase 18 [Streblomastix strix]|uniref:histone deacetylase n=1 Tax=Streblomastix strix TaxID=222440 RepID=A0A5J4W2I9_9EUKA|nr:MAG: putative Histone deacetylase 18 [Streblomastix strix]
MTKTVLYIAEECLQHKGNNPRFECPERLESAISHLSSSGLMQKCEVRKGHTCSDEDILMCHTRAHLDKIKHYQFQDSSAPFEFINQQNKKDVSPQLASDSTYICRQSLTAARWAIGGCIEGVDMILNENKGMDKQNAKNGFVLCRPPGHHSQSTTVQGFCLFNNIAIAAVHALNRLRSIYPNEKEKQRVLIVDFDVHHGNGTEEIFLAQPDILYISSHLYMNGKFYPYSGSASTVGTGAGEGRNVNIPLPCVNCGDAEFIQIFQEIIIPIAREYQPSVVLVSAGFDIMEGDSVGRMLVTPRGLHILTRLLIDGIVSAQGRVLLVLEGGYSHEVLGEGVCACVQALLGEEFRNYDTLTQEKEGIYNDQKGGGEDELITRINPNVQKRVQAQLSLVINEVKAIQSHYWGCFQ